MIWLEFYMVIYHNDLSLLSTFWSLMNSGFFSGVLWNWACIICSCHCCYYHLLILLTLTFLFVNINICILINVYFTIVICKKNVLSKLKGRIIKKTTIHKSKLIRWDQWEIQIDLISLSIHSQCSNTSVVLVATHDTLFYYSLL